MECKGKSCSDNIHQTILDEQNKNYQSEDFEFYKEGDNFWPMTIYSFCGYDFAVFPENVKDTYIFVVVMFATERECSKFQFELIVHEHDLDPLNSEVSVKFTDRFRLKLLLGSATVFLSVRAS